MNPTADRRQSARWLIYGVTLAFGTAFCAVLVFVAWSNALDRNRRDFSLASMALENGVFGSVRSAQNALENVAAFLHVKPDLDQSEFTAIVQELLGQQPHLLGLVYCPAAPGSVPDCLNGPHFVRDASVEAHLRTRSPIADNAQRWSLIAGDRDAAAAVAPAGTPGQARPLWLIKRVEAPVAASGAGAGMNFGGGLVAVILDMEPLAEQLGQDASLSIMLFSDLAGVSGRELLMSRAPLRGPGQWAVADLVREGAVQFPRYSLHLRVSRAVTWQEVDRELVYTALLIGVSVTLLLVALVRARDLQARQLRERNIVIERKVEEQTKELALARDEALDASRVKSEFLASMSHEIRTPLNAIIGMAELLSETPLTGEQKKYIDVFRKAGDTLLSLVNDILDLSKIEARQMELERIAFDLFQTIEESVEIYALKAAEKDIELVCRVDPDLDPMRRGDPARLRQVVLNLISNALKFTERGEIVVQVAGGADGGLEFAVRDTGIGIPPDKLEAIFASFTQVDSSVTRKYGGTGLGLTISRSLVEMMGGHIWVESLLGRGSTFRFALKLPPAGEGAARREPAVNLAGFRVLVVDDNATSLENVSVHLRRSGAEVSGAEGPAAALQALAGATAFDLVIVDCRMPAGGGFDLVAEMRRRGVRVRTMMMLSATDLNQHMGRLKNLGISAYLLKPVKRSELLSNVRDVLGGQQADQTAALPRAVAEERPLRPLRILLVEDNPDNRLLVRSYLKKLPWEIEEAENGQIAVDKFSGGSYDLVLMDVQMPVLDGHQATRTIREWEARNGRPRTPIVALTAHAIKEEIDKCMASGCDAYLSKPVKKVVLIDAIQAAATGQQNDGGSNAGH